MKDRTNFPVMSVMASTNLDSDNKLKKVDKKSKELFKKNKLKGSQEHINPMAIEKDIVKQKSKKVKKKGKKKSSVMSDKKGAEDQNKQEKASNMLLELKQSSSDFSSNWKNLLKSLPKEDEVTEVANRPAFVRRNKKGQLITNQKMNHPKAVLIGNKDKDKKADKSKSKDRSADAEEDEVWFDDVDPVLLDIGQSKDPSEGLVKNNSFKGATKILGMDCEMVGVGTDGVDSILARVSIVNHFGNPLYDKFVAPREKVKGFVDIF